MTSRSMIRCILPNRGRKRFIWCSIRRGNFWNSFVTRTTGAAPETVLIPMCSKRNDESRLCEEAPSAGRVYWGVDRVKACP